jgi:His/Glu/Gln/Arg/opine family amino acid ABC transporter permease subunit
MTTTATAVGGFAAVEYAGPLWGGLLTTLQISAVGMAGSILVGLAGAAAIVLRVPVLRHVVRAYVEFIRNTPLLVQVFFLFFAAPTLAITLSPFVVGCTALVAWGGAYNVENFRAGLEAVAPRYLEGARALGFSRWQAFVHVTTPIGIRLAIPGLTNTLISVLKNSALMLGIGLAELTFVVQKLSAETFRTIELYIVLGAVYLVLVLALSSFMHMLGRRYTLAGGV